MTSEPSSHTAPTPRAEHKSPTRSSEAQRPLATKAILPIPSPARDPVGHTHKPWRRARFVFADRNRWWTERFCATAIAWVVWRSHPGEACHVPAVERSSVAR